MTAAHEKLRGIKEGERMSIAYDVLIVGGGAAGIGLAASLKSRDHSLSVAIIEPSDYHYYQPSWTLVGGGVFDQVASRRPMASVMPSGVDWIKGTAESFDQAANTVTVAGREPISYEYLVLAPGLMIDWEAIPGLKESLGRNGVTSNYSYEHAPYTWELAKTMSKGTAIFTQPPLPFKCPGAPQKAAYLTCSQWKKRGVLPNINVELNNAGGALFGVKEFVPALMKYVEDYGINLAFTSNLIRVDGDNKTATFEVKDADGNATQIEKTFDMLHVSPPQCAHPFMKSSPFVNEGGWVDVDQHTMQHVTHKNVFGLGDACSTPNSKTAAAARKQIVCVAENLLAHRAGLEGTTKYDGYGACPLTVEHGKVVFAEFGYGGKLMPTFSWNNALSATKIGWLLKAKVLPWVYWNVMLKGREWFARPLS